MRSNITPEFAVSDSEYADDTAIYIFLHSSKC